MSGNIKKQIPHDYNVICDICGRKKKRSQCAMAYGNGIIPIVMSCLDKCADKLQPLNFPPPVILDGRPVPDARPDQGDNQETFVAAPMPINLWGHFTLGTWGALNGLNNEFTYKPIVMWGTFP